VCVNGQVQRSVQGMSLVRDVDYIADVAATREVISERGIACSGASDTDACNKAMLIAAGGGRGLLTTEGDVVRVWLPGRAIGLFGAIDELEEALWLAESRYQVDCTASADQDQTGYVITGVKRFVSDGCSQQAVKVTLGVALDGTLTELDTSPLPTVTCAIGRRPIGRCDLRAVRSRSALGAYFARAAQLEAASVPAFAQIGEALQKHGAPARLIAAARRAGRDEVRHARVTARLARRFGAEPEAPRIAMSKLRSLEALAFDNAREGCVLETYAALEASHQAARASDPEIRSALRGIARDELRHAAFSHALHAWSCAQLGERTRVELNAARAEAASELRAGLLAAPEPSAWSAVAGLPGRQTALALHRELARSLWNARA